MSALATRTRSLYKYDVYYRRGKKERKEIWSNFFADEGCPLKSYTRNQFTGTTNTHISLLCIGNTYYIGEAEPLWITKTPLHLGFVSARRLLCLRCSFSQQIINVEFNCASSWRKFIQKRWPLTPRRLNFHASWSNRSGYWFFATRPAATGTRLNF
jgi:hypothetical protein